MMRKSVLFSCFFLLSLFTIAQEFPSRPNTFDSQGRRTGEWVLLYDSLSRRVDSPDSASNYILVSFKKGKPIGRSEMFYASGTRQRLGILYDFDTLKIHGKGTYYFPNGNVQTEVFYDRGVRSGSHTEYYENGMLAGTGFWKDNKEHGIWEFNYPNGNLLDKGEYLEGKRSGIWEARNENGTLRSKGLYVDGKEERYWEFFHENGVME